MKSTTSTKISLKSLKSTEIRLKKKKSTEKLFKKLFILIIITTLVNLVGLLALSYILHPIQDKIYPVENVIATQTIISVSLLTFGGVSIFSRYKTRMLIFNIL